MDNNNDRDSFPTRESSRVGEFNFCGEVGAVFFFLLGL